MISHIYVRNQEISTVPIENGPLHYLVCIKHVMITQGNYSHGTIVVLISSNLRWPIIVSLM